MNHPMASNTVGLIFREVALCYVVLTLAATSLAKLRSWRASSLVVIRAQVVPATVAPFTVIGVSLVKLALATCLMLGVEPVLAGRTAAALFLIFGGYRVAVAARTSYLICACAGAARYEPLALRTLAATILTSLVQAGLSLASIGAITQRGTDRLDVAALTAWLVPFIVLLAGKLLHSLPLLFHLLQGKEQRKARSPQPERLLPMANSEHG